MEFQMAYQAQRKDPVVAILLGVFFGCFGADRFYLGHTGLGVGKLLTFGGCGVWAIVDLFLLSAAADRINLATLAQLQAAFAPSYGPQAYGFGQGQAPAYPPPPHGYPPGYPPG